MAASVLSAQRMGTLCTTKTQLQNAHKKVTGVIARHVSVGPSLLKDFTLKNVGLSSKKSVLRSNSKHLSHQSSRANASGRVGACSSEQLATLESSTSGIRDNVGEYKRWTAGKTDAHLSIPADDFQTVGLQSHEVTCSEDTFLSEDAPSDVFSWTGAFGDGPSELLGDEAQNVDPCFDERAALEAAIHASQSFQSHLTHFSSSTEEDVQSEPLEPVQKLQNAFVGTAKFVGALLLASALALASPQSALAARSMGRAGGGGFSSSRSNSSSRSSSSSSSRSSSSSSYKSSSSSSPSKSSSFSSHSGSPKSTSSSSTSSRSSFSRPSSSSSSGGKSTKSSSTPSSSKLASKSLSSMWSKSSAKRVAPPINMSGSLSKSSSPSIKPKNHTSSIAKHSKSKSKNEPKSTRRSESPSRWKVWNRTNSTTQVFIDKDKSYQEHYSYPHVGRTGHHSSYTFIQTHPRPTTTDRLFDALLGRVRSEEKPNEEETREEKDEATSEENEKNDALHAFCLVVFVVLAVWLIFFLVQLERIEARSRNDKQSGKENPNQRSHQGLSSETLAQNLITIVKIQVALLGQAKSVQRQMDKLCEEADTSSKEGLHHLLQESLLVLLRHSAYWAYGRAQTIALGYDAAEGKYQQMALEERAKAEQETLINLDGKIERMPSLRGENDELTPNEYIVVTVLAAVEGLLRTPDSASTQRTDVVAAIQELSRSKADHLEVLEVLWVPQEDDDTLTHSELVEKYTDLSPL